MRRLGLWAVLCCMLLVAALPAWAAPHVEMSVQAANEGRVKQGGWVTVVVDLANQGAELNGELVVEVDGDVPHPQYMVPFSLPAGGKKRIPVSLEGTGNMPVSVKLYAGGELVDKKSVTLSWLPQQMTMIGILSGDELGIPALNQLQAFQGQAAQVVRLSAATFPARAALLNDFDVIGLSRFDTSSLSQEQIRALEVWVGRGGTLLLFGGPEWKRTLGPLPPSLVPVQVTGVRAVELDPLGAMAGKPLSGRGTVTEGRTVTGQGLTFADGLPLIVSATAGSGRVLYMAFDPGLTPVVSWAGQGPLYNRLLGNVGQGAMNWPGEREWLLHEALKRIPDWGLPGVWTVGLLLGSYLLLVGPANYLILKRLDKREWGWLSVPGLSVLFLGLVYLIGFGRFQPLVSHLITVTEISAGTGVATMNSHLGLYAPSRERISVAVPDARLVKPFRQGPTPEGQVTARIVAGEKTNIELLGLNNFSMSGFSMEHDITVQGGLSLVEARLDGAILTGKLKNGLDQAVDGLYVMVGSTVHTVGRLEPGQISLPFELDLRNSGPTFNPKMRPMRIMGGVPLPEEAGPDSGRRNMIREYVLMTTGERLSSGVLVSGWTEAPLVAPTLPELGKLVQGANLIYSVLPLPVGGDSAEIPPGVILGRPSDPKSIEWLPNGYMLRPGTHGFTLLLPPVEAEKVGAVEVDIRTPANPNVIRVAVKNQKSGEWLSISDQIMRLPGWQEFVSPVGLIELRYEAIQHMEIQPPTVAVRGVGR